MSTSPTIASALVRLHKISKRFGSVPVLREVDFDLWAGEVHVLAGENGAGKSTLIKILGGVLTDFEGTIEVEGREVRPRTPLEATRVGVAVIHQELSLIGPMSVADNVFLGRSLSRWGCVHDERQQREAKRWLAELGLKVDVREPVERLPLAIQQLIEVTKALSQDARVLVMDEPTSALNAPEVERLFQLIDRLKARGCGLIYITHKMEEIDRVADRITVLRDGRWIGTATAAELPRAKLLHWMVGRPVSDQFPRQSHHRGKERLRLDGFGVYPRGRREKAAVANFSLSLAEGEIIGIAGLQGSGASELFLGLFGAFGGRTEGSVSLDGEPLFCRHPRQAIRRGIALLTNDRKATGLVMPMSVTANTTLAGLDRLSPGGWRRPPREVQATRQVMRPLNLRARSLDQRVDSLSGGNQQKVAIGKWLQIVPRVLLLDEPTRGIDVGAKQEIYQQMNAWSSKGIAILLVTSEMPELLALSDRLIVLHRGQITARFSRAEATPRRVLAAAMGAQQTPSSTQDFL